MDAWKHTAVAPASARPPSAVRPVRSPLVSRLIQPDIDSARRRIRHLLVQLPDERLRTGLGLSDADIAVLRTASLVGGVGASATARTLPAGGQAGPVVPAAPGAVALTARA